MRTALWCSHLLNGTLGPPPRLCVLEGLSVHTDARNIDARRCCCDYRSDNYADGIILFLPPSYTFVRLSLSNSCCLSQLGLPETGRLKQHLFHGLETGQSRIPVMAFSSRREPSPRVVESHFLCPRGRQRGELWCLFHSDENLIPSRGPNLMTHPT